MRQMVGRAARLAALIVVAAVVSSCASYEYERAREMTPTGTPFTRVLYEAYLDHSARAYEEENEELSNAFAARAMSAANGTVVAPVTPTGDALGEFAAPLSAFEGARDRLMGALVPGRGDAPDLAASAQAAFDCWYLRSIDPESDSASITRCRAEYERDIAALEAAVAPPPVMLPDPASYTAYFGFDEWFLRADALDVIAEAMETARLGGHGEIVLGGHADTSGPAGYNEGLSLRRAEAVKATMIELGARPEAIQVIGYGETDLAVQTPDGVREPLNRRVVIELMP